MLQLVLRVDPSVVVHACIRSVSIFISVPVSFEPLFMDRACSSYQSAFIHARHAFSPSSHVSATQPGVSLTCCCSSSSWQVLSFRPPGQIAPVQAHSFTIKRYKQMGIRQPHWSIRSLCSLFSTSSKSERRKDGRFARPRVPSNEKHALLVISQAETRSWTMPYLPGTEIIQTRISNQLTRSSPFSSCLLLVYSTNSTFVN